MLVPTAATTTPEPFSAIAPILAVVFNIFCFSPFLNEMRPDSLRTMLSALVSQNPK